ncbi:MAG: hypothetical protein J2P54_20440, partial [Bradyrhizobiaceae bacterium]|nr:hypothetical protein [Bradyrhizobiaceae bacterium]
LPLLERGRCAPVAIPFFAFSLMVGCAFVMLDVVIIGGWLRRRGWLYDTPVFLLGISRQSAGRDRLPLKPNRQRRWL